MGELDVGESVASNLADAVKDFAIDKRSTDASSGEKLYAWMNEEYSQYLGYYDKIPEWAGVVDVKAAWTMGKGFVADEITTMLLDTIKGNGFDTFNSIIENMDRTREIGGDAYAHIIRDEEGILINLKPLDPEVMMHISGADGMIIRFEQVSKIKGKKPKEFQPEEIFYVPRNRIADEVHGNTMAKRLVFIIKAKNEAMEIQKTINQRFAKPRWIIKLDTANPAKIAAEKRKWDKANAGGENMYIPMGSVEVEQMSISPNSTINLQTNIDNLDNKFYEAANCPKIIVGGSGGFTDAAVKTAYLAWQQTIEERQLYWEEQVLSQLNLVINLVFPASLEQGMLSQQEKDGSQAQQLNKPSEIMPTPETTPEIK